ncbi:unnamed protein product [Prunus armeniaca]|uniref:Uncharacterized protein n=1 Tax=Prunus armeniaca TaxID=36596 RepID=A0A6J5URX5_PRUAR|nr:unnamed protein product [Prunus armeniaca]CAB4308395.1 unnamed protein product [Prunus armeniaca]
MDINSSFSRVSLQDMVVCLGSNRITIIWEHIFEQHHFVHFGAVFMALCSISLVTSLFICLRKSETPMALISSAQVFPFGADMESEDEEGGEDDD